MARSRIPARRDRRPVRPPRVAGVRARPARPEPGAEPTADTLGVADASETARATKKTDVTDAAVRTREQETTGRARRVVGRDGEQPADRDQPRPRPRPYPRPVDEDADSADADLRCAGESEPPAATPRAGDGAATRPAHGAIPRIWWAVTGLAVIAVVMAVFTTILLLRWQRAEARAQARAEVPSLAKTYAAKILSYDYRHIRQDADAAARVTTGDYGRQYRQTMDQLIVPQAQQVHAVVQAEVLNAGVSSVSEDGRQAVVLVYANQTVTNDRLKGARVDQVRVRLTLVKSGGTWRVSKVDPL